MLSVLTLLFSVGLLKRWCANACGPSGVPRSYSALTDMSVNTEATLRSQRSVGVSVKRQRVLTCGQRVIQRTKLLLFLMLDLAYLPIATRILQIFACDHTTVQGLSFVMAAPYVDCASSRYFALRLAAIFGAIFCIGGVPVLFFLLIWPIRNRLDQSRLRFQLGFAWNTVKRDLFWWPWVSFGRRLVVAIFVTQFPFGSVLAPLSILALLLAVILVQLLFRPYVVDTDNSVEVALLVAALFSYVASMMAGVGGSYFGQQGVSTLNVALLIVNTAIKAALLLGFLRIVWLELRARLAFTGPDVEVDLEVDLEDDEASAQEIRI